MTCVFGPHCFSAEAIARSRSDQPNDVRAARNSLARRTFFAPASSGRRKSQRQSTSQTARLNLSFGASDVVIAATSSACAFRPAASIEADVSARISSSIGSPSVTISWPPRTLCRGLPGGLSSSGGDARNAGRRRLEQEVSILAATMRKKHDVRLPPLHFDHRLEILAGAYSCALNSKCAAWGVRALRVACVGEKAPRSGSAELTRTSISNCRKGCCRSNSLRKAY